MAKAPAKPPARSTPRPAGPPPVVAVVGDEPFLQTEAIAGLFASLPADAERVDVEGDSATLADALDEVRSLSMFGGGLKVVVVRNADEFITRYREKLEDYVAASSPGSGVLVLRCKTLPKNQRIYKAIDKAGKVVLAEPPKANALPRWVIDRGKRPHGLLVTPDAAAMLADLIGADLGRLDNELAKLALAEGDGPVTPAAVAGSVAFQREQEMWHLTDELTAGDVASAVRRWRQLTRLDTSAEFRAVTWLTMWLEKAGGALSMQQRGERSFAIAKALRIWPADNVAPLLRTATAMGEGGVARAVDALAEVDRRNKSGLGDPAANVERFLLTLA